LRGGPGINSPGQLAGEASLKTLPMRAYELKDYQIGGPAWMESERYEIAPDAAGMGIEWCFGAFVPFGTGFQRRATRRGADHGFDPTTSASTKEEYSGEHAGGCVAHAKRPPR